jgi:hypothetical protein
MICPNKNLPEWKALDKLNPELSLYYWNKFEGNLPNYLTDAKVLEDLFKSNPELANRVYDALGFNNIFDITLDKSRFNPDNPESTSYPIKINNKYAGVISINSEGYISSSIGMAGVELEKEFQGEGYGTKVYLVLANQLAKEGKTLKSEFFGKSDINKSASKVWKSLLDKGLAIDKGNYFEIISTVIPEQKQVAIQKYAEYLTTIFPDSKVKDIVYHHSSKKLEKFDKSFIGKETNAPDTQLGFFFAENKNDIPNMVIEKNKRLEELGESKRFNFSIQNNVLLNIKNPEFYYGFIEGAVSNILGREASITSQTAKQDYKEAKEKLENNGKDSLIYGLSIEPDGEGGTDVNQGYVVFEPEQIHILGNKQDIEGFKQFINSAPENNPLNIDFEDCNG